MANLKSSKKDVRKTLKRTAFNNSAESTVRTFLKKAKIAVANCENYKDGFSAIATYRSFADKLARKHLISKQSVSRHDSALVKVLKSRFKQEEQIA